MSCPHRRIRIDRDVAHRRTEHKDGKGYTVRFVNERKEGICLDCNELIREVRPGLERYEVFYDCI